MKYLLPNQALQNRYRYENLIRDSAFDLYWSNSEITYDDHLLLIEYGQIVSTNGLSTVSLTGDASHKLTDDIRLPF